MLCPPILSVKVGKEQSVGFIDSDAKPILFIEEWEKESRKFSELVSYGELGSVSVSLKLSWPEGKGCLHLL